MLTIRRIPGLVIFLLLFAVPASAQHTNATAITIGDCPNPCPASGQPASLYPSTISVSGEAGVVQRVSVTLHSFSHGFPADVDFLLVSPSGRKSVIMSDFGAGSPGVSNITVTLDDHAQRPVPSTVNGNTGVPFVSGTYRPANAGTSDLFPAPAPAAPYTYTLSAFNGDNPNGTWSLYIIDDANLDGGLISGGWTITFDVPPPPPAAGDILISEFRTRGAGTTPPGSDGSADEFIELYNNTDSSITIIDSVPGADPTSGSGAGWRIAGAQGAAETTFYVLSQTLSTAGPIALAPRSYFLISTQPTTPNPAGNTYSLATYPTGTGITASGSANVSINPASATVGFLPDDVGLAVFSTVGAVSAARLDSVGFSSVTHADYEEGTGLAPASGMVTPSQHSWTRRLTAGVPQDTGDNAADFLLVATTGDEIDGQAATLGAPGPERGQTMTGFTTTGAPSHHPAGAMTSARIDPAQAEDAAPNLVRDLTPVTNGTNGTLKIRRRYTNTTGEALLALRFRVAALSTRTGGAALAGQADLRVLDSPTQTITLTDTSTVTSQALTLQTPAAQASGGGVNSSLSVGAITTPSPLANGASVVVEFNLGVETEGPYRIVIRGEGLAADGIGGVNVLDVFETGADLAITKTDGVTTATAGGAVTYTIVASNAGPNNANGATVADTFPAALTCTWTCVGAGGTCTAAGSGDISDTVNLPAGGSVTYTASCTIAASTTGTLSNTATVSTAAGVTDPNPGNNSASDTDTAVTSPIDLAVVKTNAQTTYVPGAGISYTIVVTNAGPSVASGFSIADAVPASITGVTVGCAVTGSGSCGANGSAGNSVSFTNASLAPGAGNALTLTVDGTVSASASGPIVNIATVVAGPGSTDPNLANNTAMVTTNEASAAADLAVALTAGTLTPQIGDELPVVVSATNTSTQAMTAASIVVSLPSLLRVKDATPAQGAFDPVAMQWTLGPLAPGASTTLTLVLDVADGGPQVLQAARQASTPDDSNAANDVAQATLNIYAPGRTVADLEVRIEGSPIAAPGGTARYAIRGVNFGSTNALDEAIAVTPPPGTTFGAVTASSGGVCTAPPVGEPGQIRCVWSGQSVVGGSPRDVTLDLRMDPSVPNAEVVSVTAFVSNLTEDPTLGNNSATALTTVTTDPTVADLEIAGAFLPSGLAATVVDIDHRDVTLRFQVRNVGAAPVASARLQAALNVDVAMPALVITGVVVSQGTIDDAAAAWEVGPLAPGATATIDITATVTQVARLGVELRRVRSAPADGNAGNDRALLTIDVVPPGGGGRYIALGNTDAGAAGEVLVAGGEFETPQVQIYNVAGVLETAFLAYDPRFPGGVRLATCDVDRDGRDEIVTAAGTPDGGPHVRIFSRRPDGSLTERASWYTIDEDYRGGVYVACGDVDGDSVPEVVTGTGAEGPATIQIWRPELGTGTVQELARGTLGDIAPGYGVRVATCDVTGDGRAEIVAAAVGGSLPLVRIFDVGAQRLIRAFAAARPGEALGLQVACGNVMPGSGNEVLVGLDVGGSPIARAFSAEGAFLGEYLGMVPTPGGGVRVAVGEFDGDPSLQEFALASGLGAAPQALVGSARAGVTILLRLVPLEIP